VRFSATSKLLACGNIA